MVKGVGCCQNKKEQQSNHNALNTANRKNNVHSAKLHLNNKVSGNTTVICDNNKMFAYLHNYVTYLCTLLNRTGRFMNEA